MYKKGKETRAAIISAAMELFTTVGYENTTVRELAKMANVTPSNIYKYFSNKEDLVNTLFNDVTGELYFGLNACIEGISDTQLRLYRITEYYLDFFNKNHAAAYMIYARNILMNWRESEEAFRRARVLGDVLINILKEGQIKGEVRADVNIHLIGQLYHGGLRQIMLTWLYRNEKFNLMEMAPGLAGAIYAAIAPVNNNFVCPYSKVAEKVDKLTKAPVK
jgi:TetR/AcrR family transcriptional regulator, fatty acid metabolism regulator protein